MSPHRALHPLLLEPRYWRTRLKAQQSVGHSLLLVPRPDLSRSSVEVQEMRFRAHDGARLFGLIGRCPLHKHGAPARLRLVGPADPPSIEKDVVEGGCVDVVLQSLPGRRLEDRVLDVLRLWDLATNLEGIDPARVRLDMVSRESAPDEFLIAEELRALGLVR